MTTHNVSTHATAFGWGWGCSCGKSGTGNAAPSPEAAKAYAFRHIAADERRQRRESQPRHTTPDPDDHARSEEPIAFCECGKPLGHD